jgi:integrase
MNGRRGNGEGSVYKTADGSWRAAISIGNGKRRFVRAKTRAEAARLLNSALKAAHDGLALPGSRQTFAQFVEKWLVAVGPTVKERTITGYATLLRTHALPPIGHMPLVKVQPADLQRLYEARRAAGAAPNTVRNLHRAVSKVLRDGVRWGDLSRNVASLVDAPRSGRTKMHALTAEEARALLLVAEGDRLQVLLLLALNTGMREGEVLGLTWRAVDLDAGTVSVVASLGPTKAGLALGTPKTKSSQRTIAIDGRVVAALRRRRTAQLEERLAAGPAWQEHDLVFATKAGGPIWARVLLRDWFRPLLRRAGLPTAVRFHDLRHTFASIALARGIHPKIVQEMLGHSTIAVTLDIYSHVAPGLQRDAAREIGVALLG